MREKNLPLRFEDTAYSCDYTKMVQTRGAFVEIAGVVDENEDDNNRNGDRSK